MGINFEYIRDIQRKEKNSVRLAEVNAEFYKELAAYIKECTDNCKAKGQGFRELENIVKLAKDIYEKREQKLVMKALRSVRTNEQEADNLTAEETRLFDRLMREIGDTRSFFDDVMVGEYVFSGFNGKSEDTLIKDSANNVVLARVAHEIPLFVGSDSTEYGPYNSGEVVKLPRAEAESLAKQTLVEIL